MDIREISWSGKKLSQLCNSVKRIQLKSLAWLTALMLINFSLWLMPKLDTVIGSVLQSPTPHGIKHPRFLF